MSIQGTKPRKLWFSVFRDFNHFVFGVKHNNHKKLSFLKDSILASVQSCLNEFAITPRASQQDLNANCKMRNFVAQFAQINWVLFQNVNKKFLY